VVRICADVPLAQVDVIDARNAPQAACDRAAAPFLALAVSVRALADGVHARVPRQFTQEARAECLITVVSD
jgi:hypothetical protein